MSLSEFDIISRYFNRPKLTVSSDEQTLVALGIGDDCALIEVPKGNQLALSMDVLVANVHFPANAHAGMVAQRALAVNLSDLAAMGAKPLGFTLGLCLPEVDESWLELFSLGLESSSERFQCPLIGGDMSKGPLTISIQVHGYLPKGQALRRNGAMPDSSIYVTGSLGEAGLALKMFNDELAGLTELDQNRLNKAFYQPFPRLDVGQASLGLASAAIDISDGLLADLGHIARQSSVGMVIESNKIPVSKTVEKLVGKAKGLTYALSAGDEYELALVVPSTNVLAFEKAISGLEVPFTSIGQTVLSNSVDQSLVKCIDPSGKPLEKTLHGYKHF